MKPIGAIVFLAFMSPQVAQSEITIGGWANIESDGGTSSYKTHFRTNTLIAYQAPNFTLGIGVENLWTKSATGVSTNSQVGYALFSTGPATLSYGVQYGAGNLFPEDYFEFGDTTSISDQVLRLDVVLGQHMFGISNDLNGSGPSEIELGYSGRIGAYDLAFGYEADSGQVAGLIGRDFGSFGVQLAVMEDTTATAGPSDHAGITLFWDIQKNLTIAANIAYVTNGSIGLYSHGVLITYDWNGILAKAEFTKDNVFGTSDIEIGIVVPYGNAQPAAHSRFTLKEYRHRFLR